MGTTRSRITRKGQVTIPVEIRRHNSFREGDEIEFVQIGDEVHIRPIRDTPFAREAAFLKTLPEDNIVRQLAKLSESMPRPERAATLAELKDAASMAWTDRERDHADRGRS